MWPVWYALAKITSLQRVGSSSMTIHRTRITSDGRIQLPVQLRRELGVSAGDTVDLEMQDGQVVMRRPSKGLERIRARLAKYIDPRADLQAELKAQRVEDSQRG